MTIDARVIHLTALRRKLVRVLVQVIEAKRMEAEVAAVAEKVRIRRRSARRPSRANERRPRERSETPAQFLRRLGREAMEDKA